MLPVCYDTSLFFLSRRPGSHSNSSGRNHVAYGTGLFGAFWLDSCWPFGSLELPRGSGISRTAWATCSYGCYLFRESTSLRSGSTTTQLKGSKVLAAKRGTQRYKGLNRSWLPILKLPFSSGSYTSAFFLAAHSPGA